MKEWSAVYVWWPRRTMYLGADGYHHSTRYRSRGRLLRRKCWHGEIWYYRPEDAPASIRAWLFGEQTYCDGCKRFSCGNVCPYC